MTTETLADLAGTKPNPYPDEVKALHAALAAAQGEFPAIPKNQTAKAGSYSYDYADLATILAAVRPILSKHGLALIQRLEHPGGTPCIRTELLHAEGAAIAASFPLGEMPANPQQLGSLLTYLRRYAVVALLGIAAEEDDDARQASAKHRNPEDDVVDEYVEWKRKDAFAEQSPFQPPDIKDDVVEDLTSKQRAKIFALKTKLTDAEAFTDDQFKEGLLKAYGVDSVSGLTKAQASNLIERLTITETEIDQGGS